MTRSRMSDADRKRREESAARGFDPQRGTRCLVSLWYFDGDMRSLSKPVKCIVRHINRSGFAWEFVVELLQDGGVPGWYKGDTYRTSIDYLRREPVGTFTSTHFMNAPPSHEDVTGFPAHCSKD